MLDKITVLREDLNDKNGPPVEIEVDVIELAGFLALHRSVGKIETGDYSISHIPTGLMVGTCETEMKGREALQILTANGIEWKFMAMVSEEAKAAARKLSEVYTRVARDYIHIEGLAHPLKDFADRDRSTPRRAKR